MAQTAQTWMARGAAQPATLKQLVEDFERRLIEGALERAHGNQRRAAAALGCLPTTLNEKMRRLGLRACDRSPLAEAAARADEPGGMELVGHA